MLSNTCNTRECTECGKVKTINSFKYKLCDGQKKRAYDDICKPCSALLTRAKRKERNERIKQEKQRKRNRVRANKYYRDKKKKEERKDYYW